MGLEFLWYVTEVLLPRLKMKWAGPLFLCEETTATPPLWPTDSPERTSVGAPDLCPQPHPPFSSIYSSPSLLLKFNLLLLLQLGNTWSAKVLLPLW